MPVTKAWNCSRGAQRRSVRIEMRGNEHALHVGVFVTSHLDPDRSAAYGRRASTPSDLVLKTLPI